MKVEVDHEFLCSTAWEMFSSKAEKEPTATAMRVAIDAAQQAGDEHRAKLLKADLAVMPDMPWLTYKDTTRAYFNTLVGLANGLAEYRKTLDADGQQRLQEFIDGEGVSVDWDRSPYEKMPE